MMSRIATVLYRIGAQYSHSRSFRHLIFVVALVFSALVFPNMGFADQVCVILETPEFPAGGPICQLTLPIGFVWDKEGTITFLEPTTGNRSDVATLINFQGTGQITFCSDPQDDRCPPPATIGFTDPMIIETGNGPTTYSSDFMASNGNLRMDVTITLQSDDESGAVQSDSVTTNVPEPRNLFLLSPVLTLFALLRRGRTQIQRAF
jgi:hypothetical protein